MVNDARTEHIQRRLARRQWREGSKEEMTLAAQNPPADEINVGRRLRELRTEQGYSIRALAEISGLNFNTLSLIENDKSSPSVSTLQLLARALQVPITAFFEATPAQERVVYQKAGERRRAAFARGTLEDMGAGLTLRGGQPLLVTLEAGAESGPDPIVHTGYEFVYCLEGCLSYTIEGQEYVLKPGDSLVFEAHLPHRWFNASQKPTHSLLVICPADENDHPTERHFG